MLPPAAPWVDGLAAIRGYKRNSAFGHNQGVFIMETPIKKEFTAQEVRDWAETQSNTEWTVINRFPEAWRAFNYLYDPVEGEKPHVRRQSFIRKLMALLMEASEV